MRRVLLLLLIFAFMPGCSFLKHEPSSLVYMWRNRSTKTVDIDLYFDQAEEAFCDGNYELAECKLTEILTVDPDSLRAHNNLGRLYYDQRKYYLAAKHFSLAQDLSEQPEVQLNHLGLVYEAIGKLDAAADYFIQAIEFDPDCVIYKSHLARVYVRQNRRDSGTENLLLETAEKDDREGWRQWANLQISKIREKNTREMEDSATLSTPARDPSNQAPGPLNSSTLGY